MSLIENFLKQIYLSYSSLCCLFLSNPTSPPLGSVFHQYFVMAHQNIFFLSEAGYKIHTFFRTCEIHACFQNCRPKWLTSILRKPKCKANWTVKRGSFVIINNYYFIILLKIPLTQRLYFALSLSLMFFSLFKLVLIWVNTNCNLVYCI